MINNYTQIQLNITEYISRLEEKYSPENELPDFEGPSTSVINNLLNYSKALSVVTDNSGKVHMVLLN